MKYWLREDTILKDDSGGMTPPWDVIATSWERHRKRPRTEETHTPPRRSLARRTTTRKETTNNRKVLGSRGPRGRLSVGAYASAR